MSEAKSGVQLSRLIAALKKPIELVHYNLERSSSLHSSQRKTTATFENDPQGGYLTFTAQPQASAQPKLSTQQANAQDNIRVHLSQIVGLYCGNFSLMLHEDSIMVEHVTDPDAYNPNIPTSQVLGGLIWHYAKKCGASGLPQCTSDAANCWVTLVIDWSQGPLEFVRDPTREFDFDCMDLRASSDRHRDVWSLSLHNILKTLKDADGNPLEHQFIRKVAKDEQPPATPTTVTTASSGAACDIASLSKEAQRSEQPPLPIASPPVAAKSSPPAYATPQTARNETEAPIGSQTGASDRAPTVIEELTPKSSTAGTVDRSPIAAVLEQRFAKEAFTPEKDNSRHSETPVPKPPAKADDNEEADADQALVLDQFTVQVTQKRRQSSAAGASRASVSILPEPAQNTNAQAADAVAAVKPKHTPAMAAQTAAANEMLTSSTTQASSKPGLDNASTTTTTTATVTTASSGGKNVTSLDIHEWLEGSAYPLPAVWTLMPGQVESPFASDIRRKLGEKFVEGLNVLATRGIRIRCHQKQQQQQHPRAVQASARPQAQPTFFATCKVRRATAHDRLNLHKAKTGSISLATTGTAAATAAAAQDKFVVELTGSTADSSVDASSPIIFPSSITDLYIGKLTSSLRAAALSAVSDDACLTIVTKTYVTDVSNPNPSGKPTIALALWELECANVLDRATLVSALMALLVTHLSPRALAHLQAYAVSNGISRPFEMQSELMNNASEQGDVHPGSVYVGGRICPTQVHFMSHSAASTERQELPIPGANVLWPPSQSSLGNSFPSIAGSGAHRTQQTCLSQEEIAITARRPSLTNFETPARDRRASLTGAAALMGSPGSALSAAFSAITNVMTTTDASHEPVEHSQEVHNDSKNVGGAQVPEPGAHLPSSFALSQPTPLVLNVLRAWLSRGVEFEVLPNPAAGWLLNPIEPYGLAPTLLRAWQEASAARLHAIAKARIAMNERQTAMFSSTEPRYMQPKSYRRPSVPTSTTPSLMLSGGIVVPGELLDVDATLGQILLHSFIPNESDFQRGLSVNVVNQGVIRSVLLNGYSVRDLVALRMAYGSTTEDIAATNGAPITSSPKQGPASTLRTLHLFYQAPSQSAQSGGEVPELGLLWWTSPSDATTAALNYVTSKEALENVDVLLPGDIQAGLDFVCRDAKSDNNALSLNDVVAICVDDYADILYLDDPILAAVEEYEDRLRQLPFDASPSDITKIFASNISESNPSKGTPPTSAPPLPPPHSTAKRRLLTSIAYRSATRVTLILAVPSSGSFRATNVNGQPGNSTQKRLTALHLRAPSLRFRDVWITALTSLFRASRLTPPAVVTSGGELFAALRSYVPEFKKLDEATSVPAASPQHERRGSESSILGISPRSGKLPPLPAATTSVSKAVPETEKRVRHWTPSKMWGVRTPPPFALRRLSYKPPPLSARSTGRLAQARGAGIYDTRQDEESGPTLTENPQEGMEPLDDPAPADAADEEVEAVQAEGRTVQNEAGASSALGQLELAELPVIIPDSLPPGRIEFSISYRNLPPLHIRAPDASDPNFLIGVYTSSHALANDIFIGHTDISHEQERHTFETTFALSYNPNARQVVQLNVYDLLHVDPTNPIVTETDWLSESEIGLDQIATACVTSGKAFYRTATGAAAPEPRVGEPQQPGTVRVTVAKLRVPLSLPRARRHMYKRALLTFAEHDRSARKAIRTQVKKLAMEHAGSSTAPGSSSHVVTEALTARAIREALRQYVPPETLPDVSVSRSLAKHLHSVQRAMQPSTKGKSDELYDEDDEPAAERKHGYIVLTCTFVPQTPDEAAAKAVIAALTTPKASRRQRVVVDALGTLQVTPAATPSSLNSRSRAPSPIPSTDTLDSSKFYTPQVLREPSALEIIASKPLKLEKLIEDHESLPSSTGRPSPSPQALSSSARATSLEPVLTTPLPQPLSHGDSSGGLTPLPEPSPSLLSSSSAASHRRGSMSRASFSGVLPTNAAMKSPKLLLTPDREQRLIEGFRVTKFSHDKGKPQERTVFYDKQRRAICWSKSKSDRKVDSERCIPLTYIADVVIGKHTFVMQNYSAPRAMHPMLCVSIIQHLVLPSDRPTVQPTEDALRSTMSFSPRTVAGYGEEACEEEKNPQAAPEDGGLVALGNIVIYDTAQKKADYSKRTDKAHRTLDMAFESAPQAAEFVALVEALIASVTSNQGKRRASIVK